MARTESHREDLLREATALVERIEIVTDIAEDGHIIAGFRSDGSLSVFFAEDPVYQFNAAGQLRRAYQHGLLVKATSGRLVSLRRVRHEHQVELLRHDFSDEEQSAFLADMARRMFHLGQQLVENRFTVVGQVPHDGDVATRIRQYLAGRSDWQVASSPRVG